MSKGGVVKSGFVEMVESVTVVEVVFILYLLDSDGGCCSVVGLNIFCDVVFWL